MYWLKPFDAVNDTANAVSLLKFDWSKKPILEIGGGDGVFSFIMHGGEFAFLDDRYNQTDPSKSGDIYDVYRKDLSSNVKKIPLFQYNVGVDLKLSHLYKSKETGLYKHNNLISAKPESLPIKNDAFSTVFLYTFHGLTDYRQSLKEIRRVIRKDGSLLMIAVNGIVKEHFICYKLHRYCEKMGWNKLSKYFLKLDGGRYNEIGKLFAKDFDEWKQLFNETGFQTEEVYTQVKPLLWMIYDTQTRPFLKSFIHLNLIIKKFYLKPVVKFIWIYLWFPFLVVYYLFFARHVKIGANSNPQGIFLGIKAKLVFK